MTEPTLTTAAFITILALFVYLWTSVNVGRARKKYGILAPLTAGNTDFERVFRAHMNTLEQMAIFLPALWLFALFPCSPGFAGPVIWLLGGGWLLGRIAFAIGYYRAPDGRRFGFILSIISSSLLLLAASAGVVMHLFRVVL